MPRFVFLVVAAVVAGGWLDAAPVPEDARLVVARLNDPSTKVRDEAAVALVTRPDALPWLRRVARSADKDAAKRAAELLALHDKKRQEVVAKAIEACVRDGCIDLLTEWHQYWRPKATVDLWTVGLRAAKAGHDLLSQTCPKAVWDEVAKRLDQQAGLNTNSHDGPYPDRFESFQGAWNIRTDRMDGRAHAADRIRFASVAGPTWLSMPGGQYLVLGSVRANRIDTAFVACDGGVWHEMPEFGPTLGVRTTGSVVVCRGNVTAGDLIASVVLVDGDIDLTMASDLRFSVIRATGEIRMPKFKDAPLTGALIQAHAKDATSPYKFFELADVGLTVVDDEEGLVVAEVKPGTPFGASGLKKGDMIQAIDDVPPGHSTEFRKQVRRAMVRQGDCLLTVARGREKLDLPVYFPPPK
jgi:hypothetical protein